MSSFIDSPPTPAPPLVRVRFAPSPTGSLHLGNARTALFNWLFARHHGGAFILRIEDTDIERDVEGAESGVREDLAWVGLDWDEGPDVGGEFGPYRQSERLPLYRSRAAELLEAGAAYHCFCSPERLEEDRRRLVSAGKTPRYLGHCAALAPDETRRRLEGGEAAALRLRLASFPAVEDMLRGEVDFALRQPSDPVLLRRDRRPTYNFAVVVDDLAMRISHVLRGDDHLSNTPVQVRIYEAFGAPPPLFAHLPTVLGPDGSPLSKRHGAVSLGEMRRRGYPPEGLAGALMFLGWTPRASRQTGLPEDGPHGMERGGGKSRLQDETGPDGVEGPLPLVEAALMFDLRDVSLSAATFDRARLDFLAARAIARQTAQQRATALLAWISRHRGDAHLLGWLDFLPDPVGWTSPAREWLGMLLDLWSGQVSRYEEYRLHARFVFRFEESLAEQIGSLGELRSEESVRVLQSFRLAAAEIGPLATEEQYQEAVRLARENSGARGRPLFHPLRLALTASESGPELRRLVPLLDSAALAGAPIAILSARQRIERVIESFCGGIG